MKQMKEEKQKDFSPGQSTAMTDDGLYSLDEGIHEFFEAHSDDEMMNGTARDHDDTQLTPEEWREERGGRERWPEERETESDSWYGADEDSLTETESPVEETTESEREREGRRDENDIRDPSKIFCGCGPNIWHTAYRLRDDTSISNPSPTSNLDPVTQEVEGGGGSLVAYFLHCAGVGPFSLSASGAWRTCSTSRTEDQIGSGTQGMHLVPPRPHLVEVVRINTEADADSEIEDDGLDQQQKKIFCVLAEHPNGTSEYRVLPRVAASGGGRETSIEPSSCWSSSLLLQARWVVNCAVCDAWYVVNVCC